MPLSSYDRLYGGKRGAAAKAKAAMARTYGDEKGENVFYATARARANDARGGIASQVRAVAKQRRGKRRRGSSRR